MIDILHKTGVKNVVITSVSLSPTDLAAHAAIQESTLTTTTINRSFQQDQQEGEKTDDLLMYCVCSSRRGDQDDKPKVFAIGFPTYDGYFTGTGDLFSALLVARLFEAFGTSGGITNDHGLVKEPCSALAQACVKVVATMKAVVLRTFLAQKGITSGGHLDQTQASSAAVVKQCELRLIQSKRDIEQPDVEGLNAIELRL